MYPWDDEQHESVLTMGKSSERSSFDRGSVSIGSLKLHTKQGCAKVQASAKRDQADQISGIEVAGMSLLID